jgi:hypothetical protein
MRSLDNEATKLLVRVLEEEEKNENQEMKKGNLEMKTLMKTLQEIISTTYLRSLLGICRHGQARGQANHSYFGQLYLT